MWIFLFFLLIVVSITLDTYRLKISPMPSSKNARTILLKILEEKEFKTVVDLGSGWGHILFFLSRKFPQAKIIGYESALVPYLFSRIFKYVLRKKNITIYKRNFLKETPLSSDIFFCYLYPLGMQKVLDKFKKQEIVTNFLISNVFSIPLLLPKEIFSYPSFLPSNVYVYNMKDF